MKAAVYSGTRNIYKDMIPSMKSLLIHSDVDKIYFLIEDDEFPYPLPPEVECINVSNQIYFPKDGPNYNSNWSYMILLRGALTKIFPQLDKILSLDCDTIIEENISFLWDIPLEDYYLAAVKEVHKTTFNKLYINTGVMLLNLKKIREDKKDDEIISDLNTYKRAFPEQDCFNDLFFGKILELSSDYNVNYYTKKPLHKKILHFAAIKQWQKMPIVKKYQDMEIQRNVPDRTGLDIIIPFYNDIKGLETTLKSVVSSLPNIQITVVDDCSEVNYDDIKELFPSVNFLRLEKNSGPGIARQYGIDNTSNQYIMFVDTGDYILSQYNLLEVIQTIAYNSVPCMYLWRWLNEEHKSYSGNWNSLLHGWVIKRDFLNLYNIRFCEESPRSNEDYGFIGTCNLIAQDLKNKYNENYIYFNEAPIYMYTYNPESITHADNKLYMYTTHIFGLVTNVKHIVKNCINNNVNVGLIADLTTKILIRLYQDFLICARKKPEFCSQNWQYLRDYYLKVYKPFSKINPDALQNYYCQNLKNLTQLTSKLIPKINLISFLILLEKNEEMPQQL